MCDYSLCGVPNRIAVDGEELIAHRFPTGSIGLASPSEVLAYQAAAGPIRSLLEVFAFPTEQVTAVCVPPGTRLLWKGVPPQLAWPWRLPDDAEVIFTQTNADENQYRDAIRLPDGGILMLQQLSEGTRMQVISCAVATEKDQSTDVLAEAVPVFRAGVEANLWH